MQPLPETPMKTSHWNPATDGPLSVESVGKKLGDMGYLCTCYTYAPGTLFPEHTHSVDKIDVVLQGRFLVHINGENHVLLSGDYIFIPKGTLHRAAVMGDEDVVSIDAEKSVRE
jgi:quercetin dioxygenase-like cupin family protein